MLEWQVTTIGAVSTVFDGPHATPRTVDSGPIFLGIGALNKGRLDLSDTRHVTHEDYVTWTRRVRPQADDVVFSYETRIGEAAIIPEGLQCCLGRRMGLVRVDRSVLDPWFFLYFYLAPPFQEFLRSRTIPGATVDRIALKEFPSFPLALPPLDDQRRIASALRAIDDKIELNLRMNETLEALARTLFKDWFVDFGPTRAKMAGSAPYLAPDIWALFPDRLDDKGRPEGWGVASVYEFAKVIYGAPFASGRFNSEGRGLPLIRIRDLALHEPGVFTDEEHSKGHKIEPGDLVVGMDGEFRLHVWKGVMAWLNQRVCSFEPKAGVPASFLSEALKEPLAFFERGKVGTTVIHLGKADIDTFSMLRPSGEALAAYGGLCDTLIQRTVANVIENRTLAATRDLLLPKLLSGEIRIHDAETMIEDAA